MPPDLQAIKGGRGHHDQTVVKKVSRRAEDDGHGGAWKVAFADFCLALLCLFLVLWLLASRNSERLQVILNNASANLIDEGQGMHNTLANGAKGSMIERYPVPARSDVLSPGDPTRGGGDPRQGRPSLDSPEQLQALAQRISKLAADEGLQGHLRTAVTPQGLRLQLHDTESSGMFERGSAQPSERLAGLLRKLGPMLAQIRNQLLIVGHTDSTPYQDKTPGAFSNWALSSHRAMAARHELLSGGMPESSVLQVVGMADAAPLEPANPAAPANRRIELFLLTSAQSQAIAAMYGPFAPERSELGEQVRSVVAPAASAAR